MTHTRTFAATCSKFSPHPLSIATSSIPKIKNAIVAAIIQAIDNLKIHEEQKAIGRKGTERGKIILSLD